MLPMEQVQSNNGATQPQADDDYRERILKSE